MKELTDLKILVAKQQEEITRLESKLDLALIENEGLKVERVVAVSLQDQIKRLPSSSEQSSSCQQVITDVMRKSFQTFVKDSRRKSLELQSVNETLQQENSALKQQLSLRNAVVLPKREKVHERKDITVTTCDETQLRSSYNSSNQSSWLTEDIQEAREERCSYPDTEVQVVSPSVLDNKKLAVVHTTSSIATTFHDEKEDTVSYETVNVPLGMSIKEFAASTTIKTTARQQPEDDANKGRKDTATEEVISVSNNKQSYVQIYTAPMGGNTDDICKTVQVPTGMSIKDFASRLRNSLISRAA